MPEHASLHVLPIDRRSFLGYSLGVVAAMTGPFTGQRTRAMAQSPSHTQKEELKFGLVTYMWGHDWDLPAVIDNCVQAGAKGVELRTGHSHGVEPQLSKLARQEVKQRFADSPITLVGLGSNEDFHDPDAASLMRSIKIAKEYLQLSHDVGGSGVKVKPNDLPDGIPHERTIEQIGRALNDLGDFASNLGQQVRLEVHGQCAPLPTIAKIMAVVDRPSVGVCWNSNPQDLSGEGIEHNFNLVSNRLGATAHVRQLESPEYPYAKLFGLFRRTGYTGWVLIEGNDLPADRIAALAAQRIEFEKLVEP